MATTLAPAAGTTGNLRAAIADALLEHALPGELAGFDEAARLAAAEFVAEVASRRENGRPAIRLESTGGDAAAGERRRMRLAIVNDDMPFLVDSVAASVTAHDLDIERLLHPIVAVRREADGVLEATLPADASGERRESFIYMEIERADAKARRALEADLRAVLEDGRNVVADWAAMQATLRRDAEQVADGEAAALMRWFIDRNLTLLGHCIEHADGSPEEPLGLFRRRGGHAMWSDAAREAALAFFVEGGQAPLLLKSDCVSTVHRRVPLDLVVMPIREDGRVTALSIHAGLWTSAALRTSSDKVPVLRSRLAALEAKHGFDPAGHAGKALRHVLSTLPHDLMVSISAAELERLALTAMSLADRPRPKLLLVPSPLRRQLFAFVWLPRDELTTQRRTGVADMIARASGAAIANWALDLDDSGLALLRFVLDLPQGASLPDAAMLDEELEAMLRGWAPALEAELAHGLSPARAARLTLAWADAFPHAYRDRFGAIEAAEDVRRLAALEDARDCGVRLSAGDDGALHLKIYRSGDILALSEVVPVLENFGFRVLAEEPTALDDGALGHIHDFQVALAGGNTTDLAPARAAVIEVAIAAVLETRAENDAFNMLLVAGGLDPQPITWLRAWFRYLRQAGLTYGMNTVVGALQRAPKVTRGLIELFTALHAPDGGDAAAVDAALDEALIDVVAIDDDRILRRLRAVIAATLRTNAFTPAADEALAFKLESALIPGLPAPVPWREIWIYSPRVEGIHLRGGPIARGGIRWSDRRDDFRTEILGLMKAQVVKNAVIVPTGAKGGFYPKQLPPPGERDAWLAEGTESYRVFIRTLLSVTDNIVEDRVAHPAGVTIRDGEDPYFVVAADKGTAAFSDVANAIAIEHGFWLGDAFASGGSQGYDHKAMGITARGAWIGVQRHFAEMGVDVQTQPITVVGCGDMSGDVFGNGMLLSKAIRLVAAFDHRHIFLDPAPDPAASWAERDRMFRLPRSSWADYDASLISQGGGVFPRAQKMIPVSPQIAAVLGIAAGEIDPSGLIAAILKAPVDLLWFGGIGTYVKARAQANAEVGDPANDANRVDGETLRVKAIGEGANLGVTQAGRIAFALQLGRLNTDFIDNSAGVDCSDNEVNIKIALNREMRDGRLSFDDRNALLASMTDEVAHLVLEDNRLQTLALSLAERGGARALPSFVRVIETLEGAGRLDRAVEGLEGNQELLRRGQDGGGLTRPELAVLLSHGKLMLQSRLEKSGLLDDAALEPVLFNAFPQAMRGAQASAIRAHRLRGEIIATKLANTVVNRLGVVATLELAEEEGVSPAQVAIAYHAADLIFGLTALWRAIETAPVPEDQRLTLLETVARIVRLHVADILRSVPTGTRAGEIAATLKPGVDRLDAAAEDLLREEARLQSGLLRKRLGDLTGPLADRIVRLADLDGVVGAANLARETGTDEVRATTAYVRLGEALGLDWAKSAAVRFQSSDPWERLLTAGLSRDFEQLRLEFLARQSGGDPVAAAEDWLKTHAARVAQFRILLDRARAAPRPTAAMLAQIGAQARVLLGR